MQMADLSGRDRNAFYLLTFYLLTFYLLLSYERVFGSFT